MLDYAFVSQKTDSGKKHSDVGEVSIEVASPFEEGLAERGAIIRVREEGEELARVPDSFLLVRREFLKERSPRQEK